MPRTKTAIKATAATATKSKTRVNRLATSDKKAAAKAATAGKKAPSTLRVRKVKLAKDDVLEYLSTKDKRLGRVIEAVGGLRLTQDPMQSPFQALAKAIVYQQLSGKAAATIFQRVLSLYEDDRLDPLLILDTADQKLRAQGLSQNKMLALKDLAEKTASGAVPTLAELKKMTDEEIIESLTAVRGVGRWTVEMLLIFRLGRPDVLPATDYGIRKGLCLTHRMRDLPTPLQVLERGEKWKPYRSYASWYLWRSLELEDGVI